LPIITDIRVCRGQGAYYCEDITALQERSIEERDRWSRPAMTEGFSHVREVAETVSVGLELDDGTLAWGDCVGVSYGGKAGRDSIFRADRGQALLEKTIAPLWIGRQITRFREAADELDKEGYPSAIAYGFSQSLLGALAAYRRLLPHELISAEWGLPRATVVPALHGSCGNDRTDNVDKMIVNRLEALPHGQVDDFEKQFGANGEKLLDWASAVIRRVAELAPTSYRPTLHFDVHGAMGRAFPALEQQLEFLRKLETACRDYAVRLESALMEPSREEQVEAFLKLRRAAREQNIRVALVADEWANTHSDIEFFAAREAVDMIHIKMPDLGGIHHSVQAVLTCRKYGVDALLGGSCIETDLSARYSVHVALATRPAALLVKPGMGINEGLSLMRNEISRSLTGKGETDGNDSVPS